MSALLDDCLKYIFGLSRTVCECFEADKPDEYNSSDSGIFLDELAGLNLNMVDAARDCSANSVWNKMANARDQAVKQFKNDLLSCIATKTKMKRRPFSGVIGDYQKFTRDLIINNTYAGIKVRFADIIGGFGKLKRIGLVFSATSTVDVIVYNNLQSTPVITYTGLPTVAGKVSWVTLPEILEIDMNSQSSSFVEYYFLFQYDAANKPKDTRFTCMCGGAFNPSWNENYPQYNTFNDKGNFGWAQYAMARGVTGNDINSLIYYPSTWANSEFTNGLILDIQFGCKAEKTICNEQLDYVSNPYAMAMAYAARYKAGELLLNDIMASSQPNYYTVLASELMPQYAEQYRKEYDNRVQLYLCEEISKPENINDYSDCFTCRDEYGFIKSGLFN